MEREREEEDEEEDEEDQQQRQFLNLLCVRACVLCVWCLVLGAWLAADWWFCRCCCCRADWFGVGGWVSNRPLGQSWSHPPPPPHHHHNPLPYHPTTPPNTKTQNTQPHTTPREPPSYEYDKWRADRGKLHRLRREGRTGELQFFEPRSLVFYPFVLAPSVKVRAWWWWVR
jgi:hypothetical protein